MQVDVFKALADKIFLNSNQPEITFLFHGGEPMLLPNNWYEEAIAYAIQKAEQTKKRVKFSIQTNLVSLTGQKLELIRKFKIHPGISLDNSIYHTGERGKEDKVFGNFLKLKNAGISCGILSTINRSNYNRFDDICLFLEKEAGVRQFKANVVTPVGRGFAQDPLRAEHIHEAEVNILEYMIRSEGRLRETNLMLELQRFFATDQERLKMTSSLCHEKTCGAGTKVLGITPDGNILPCGRFQWDDTGYFMGNIHQVNTDFEKKKSDFHIQVPENWYNCSDCEARKICRFGCQAFILRSEQKANIDCLPTKMRYRYFAENKERLKFLVEKNVSKENSSENENFLFSFSSKTIVN